MVSDKWKKRSWLAQIALLAGAAATWAAGAPAQAAQPQPVRVRFEHLAWVGAKTVMPQLASGQVLVPPAEACDLLGLDCAVGKDSVSVGGQTLRLIPALVTEPNITQTFKLTSLAPLIKLSGQNLNWDAKTRTATVSGGSGSKGWRYALDYLGRPQHVYSGPLQASRAALQLGKPTVAQSVTASAPLDQLTYFSKITGRLNIVGAQMPGTPDNPNKWPGCGGQLTCTLPVPRDALWVLALVTAK
ncbi:hypothetical protein [Deinococcus sp.]|uniref:hypothetical protein n=1 Tax=Deinococcus sp. TaxID=47478 RepID=UPI0025BF20F5|nr:hypothetical protein [Deinococcus sp.]